MTVTLNLPPDVELAFLNQANGKGISPGELLAELLRAAQPSGAARSAETAGARLVLEGGSAAYLDGGRRDAGLGAPGTRSRVVRTSVKLFLDSSVLIPVFLAEHPHHVAILALYRQCNPDVYSTLTRLPIPHRATPAQGVQCLDSIRSGFQFVSLSGESYLAAIRAAAAGGISGGTIYDALIAKCAIEAGADQIFTWNIRHYKLLGADVRARVRASGRVPRPRATTHG